MIIQNSLHLCRYKCPCLGLLMHKQPAPHSRQVRPRNIGHLLRLNSSLQNVRLDRYWGLATSYTYRKHQKAK